MPFPSRSTYELTHPETNHSSTIHPDEITNKKKTPQLRYTIPRFVQELQWGGGVLLAHWFYYRRNYNPLEIKNRPKTLLSDLTDEQFAFMVESYTSMGRICTFD